MESVHRVDPRRLGRRHEAHGATRATRWSGATLRPVVTTSAPGKSFGWRGRLAFRGVFDAVHRFELEALPAGGTHFVQSEHFSGLLVPLLRRSLRTHTLAGFEAMNRALQARVEGR